MTCKWLPELFCDPEWADYDQYEEDLYGEFLGFYRGSPILFLNTDVSFKRKPEYNGKDESFYHMTCRDFKVNRETGELLDRDPDIERLIRLEWSKAFIENHDCNNGCCNEPHYWTKMWKNGNLRHKILKDRFLVVLEQRPTYFLFITGYYIDKHRVRGLLSEYQKSTT